MVHAIVQQNDGWRSRVWLRSVVRNIQSGLVASGFEVDVDGRFGQGTARALREFQTQAGIDPTGITDRATWEQLEPAITAGLDKRQADIANQLPEFRGDLHWVHDQEGHKGQPYWPGGASGVTLDPGVDLGHANPDMVNKVYRRLISDAQYAAVERVLGVRGDEAAGALQADELLQSIRLTHDQAETVFPFTAHDYWKNVCARFRVDRESAIPAIQTVLLSLGFNRGAGNPQLAVLIEFLETERWADVADRVGQMQQSHALSGIRKRRRAEANLIRAELEYLNS